MSVAEPRTVAQPRWATPRSDRPSYINEVLDTAAWLGLQLGPWQIQTLEVATEYDADTGRLWYREVTFSTPRQSGKSTWAAVYLAWRTTYHARRFGQQRAAYSAQNGRAARNKLFFDWVPLWESGATPIVDVARRSIGGEQITFTIADSTLILMSSMTDAGHGAIFDVGLVDEAFSDEDDRREQAMLPAMMTRADPQLIVCSTAGDNGAFYLRRKMDAGRERIENGEATRIVYFEWSAPDECDADDEDIWFGCMPMLGVTQPIEAVRHARQTMRDSEFRRAFLNQWTASAEAAIPWATYQSRCSPDVTPSGDAIHVALDCTPDREHGCIAIAAKVDGGVAVELVENRSGLAWMLDEVLRRAGQRQPERISLQAAGPLSNLIPVLENEGMTISGLTQTEMAQASSWFHDVVIAGGIGIRSHEDLDRAVQGARKVKMADSFRWARMSSAINLSPLVAASMAGWSAHISPGASLWMHV